MQGPRSSIPCDHAESYEQSEPNGDSLLPATDGNDVIIIMRNENKINRQESVSQITTF